MLIFTKFFCSKLSAVLGTAERFIIMVHSCLQMSLSSCSDLYFGLGPMRLLLWHMQSYPSGTEPTHMHNTIIVSALMPYDFLLTMN